MDRTDNSNRDDNELRYPRAPGFKERDGASEEAANAIAPNLRQSQAATLAALEAAGRGLTADELAREMKRSILSIRPRVSELARLGRIRKTGDRRKNESGCDATVWIPAPPLVPTSEDLG